MNTVMKKSFNSPDETMNPTKRVKVEIIKYGETVIKKVTAQPGWKWSEDLKPIQKTESCQTDHLVYVISGRVHSRMNDGTELEVGPGEVGNIPPGHNGWTVGDEPAVWLELPH